MSKGKQLGHLAIIMDGNGRWAKSRQLSRVEGHRLGAKVALDVIKACVREQLKEVTLYGLSTENMQRPIEEVRFIVNLLADTLEQEYDLFMQEGIKIKILGDISMLGERINAVQTKVELATKNNQGMHLCIAFNYSGRWQIKRAVSACFTAWSNGKIADEGALQQHFCQQLYDCNQSDPDLLIRTGGEQRLSNFMLYQCAYSELAFSRSMWPDFTTEELLKWIRDYQQRNRRFGQIESLEAVEKV